MDPSYTSRCLVKIQKARIETLKYLIIGRESKKIAINRSGDWRSKTMSRGAVYYELFLKIFEMADPRRGKR